MYAETQSPYGSAALPEAFLSILKNLIRHPSVIGAEHSFYRVLQRELEERNVKVTWYEGLLVAEGDSPDSWYLSAHTDRHGLICTGPDEFQYAAFVAGARSDLLGNSVSESLMKKVVTRFEGESVFAYEPWSGSYLGQGRINGASVCPKRNNVIFDVTGLEHLVAGTPIAFRDQLTIKDDAIVGQLDNIFSVAVLIYLFEIGYQGTAFFTAQEEAGKSWRYLLEWFRRFGSTTNQLLVLDTSPYPDLNSAAKHNVILRRKDANSTFNQELTQRLANTCQALGLSYQYKDEYVESQNIVALEKGLPPASIGSTEMGRIIVASNKMVDGTTVQVATSGYHTLAEAAPKTSVKGFIDLLEHLVVPRN
ncbi:MAG: peptidase M42 [Aliiglaciecola sp.]